MVAPSQTYLRDYSPPKCIVAASSLPLRRTSTLALLRRFTSHDDHRDVIELFSPAHEPMQLPVDSFDDCGRFSVAAQQSLKPPLIEEVPLSVQCIGNAIREGQQ